MSGRTEKSVTMKRFKTTMKDQILSLISDLNFITVITITTAFITVALFNLAIF